MAAYNTLEERGVKNQSEMGLLTGGLRDMGCDGLAKRERDTITDMHTHPQTYTQTHTHMRQGELANQMTLITAFACSSGQNEEQGTAAGESARLALTFPQV